MMRKLDLYWMTNPEWFFFPDVEDDDVEPILTETAPPEARESFERYIKQKKTMN